MIQQWNAIVKPQDHIYHLGDVTMARKNQDREAFIKLIRSLNGHKRLIMGNHDQFHVKTYLDAGFEKVMAMNRLDRTLWLTHVPVHPSSMGSAIANIHGHTHANPDYTPILQVNDKGTVLCKPYINVCVEKTNYQPIHLEKVKQLVTKRIKEANG